jgi:alanyl-tRNA synthetase
LNEETILRRADNVTFETVAGEAILIDMNTGTYFSLNEVGTTFWENLDGSKSLVQLSEEIAATYSRKSAAFVSELVALAKSTAVAESSLQKLGETYGLEVEEVNAYLAELQSGDVVQTAERMTQELQVESAMVLDDLLELSQTMLADNLLVVVRP